MIIKENTEVANLPLVNDLTVGGRGLGLVLKLPI